MDELIGKEVDLYLDTELVSFGTLRQSVKDKDYFMIDADPFGPNDWFFKTSEIIDISGNKIFIKFP